MISPVNYQVSMAQVESLLSQLPFDAPTFSNVKKIAKKFLKDLTPKLQHASYKNVAKMLTASCSVRNSDSAAQDPQQTAINLLQGMRFLSSTHTKQLHYLTLGNLYEKKEIAKAEAYAKKHELNPTFAHSFMARPDFTLALITALGRAGYQGDIEVARSLIPYVDMNFGVSSPKKPDSELPLPHQMVVISQIITSAKKIEMLDLFKKRGISPFLRNPDGWWLSTCLGVPLNPKKPEVLHSLLEGAQDLSTASYSSSANSSESILDELLSDTKLAMLNFLEVSFRKMLEGALMENAVVLISHGVPLRDRVRRAEMAGIAITELPALQVKDQMITVEVAKRVHNEEKGKLMALQEKCASAVTGVLTPFSGVKPVLDIVLSYTLLSERSMRILTARNCFKRIFGYDPNQTASVK